MWDDLLRVDWGRLTHAYGRARDVPDTLHKMIAADERVRAEGWDAFWGAVNHQGDFYDSTVAAVPFLIEAVGRPGAPGRAAILTYFRDRWLDSPEYGGDPLAPEPPGGEDVPTPVLTDEELAVVERSSGEGREQHDGEEPEFYPRMDLHAWQFGRRVHAGRPIFESLLDDPDREVAAAAAVLLLLWRETRALAKQALVRTIAGETDAVEQARRVLEFGVYGASEDVGTLADWVASHRPGPIRAAAALVWAWLVNPGTLPEPVADALVATSAAGSDAFARLPWVGVYQRGPWLLPANAAGLVLRLAESEDKELRWRAVQGLSVGRETAKHLAATQVVPVLLKSLSDDYNRIRAAAAYGLSQRGELVLAIEPNAVPVLIRALDGHQSRAWGDTMSRLDSDSSICGHAARLLAALARHLTPAQRQAALAGVDRAVRRYAGRENEYVSFESLGVQASSLLRQQRDLIATPRSWGVAELFGAFAVPGSEDRPTPGDCDRRLAEAYADKPEQAIAAAMQAVRTRSDRWAAIGASQWLMSLGPAAEVALEALEFMVGGPLDPYAQEQALTASKFIRQSLLVTRDVGAAAVPSARAEVARLVRAAAEKDVHRRDALIAEMIVRLDHADAYVRAGAAEGLAILTPASDLIAAALPALERMLTDEEFVEVGVAGAYECEGRLVHWRHERRSPRANAVRALFAIGRIPDGDRMLTAMLAESTHAKAVCGTLAEPQRFTIAQWRLAAEAAGGLADAEPRIRAARQQCQSEPWPGHHGPYLCASELAEVIRTLSGRLVQ